MNQHKRRQRNTATRRHLVPFLLPVRAKLSFLATLQAWLWQCWHQWRTKQLIVQPPLQPGRQKPFPNRPHHQRRQTVFAALAAAPAGLTRRQLMAHVRAVTGIGCSEKLITVWRKERLGTAGTPGLNGDNEATQRGRESKKRKRATQLRLFLACLSLGAAMNPWYLPVGAQDITISPAPTEIPTRPSPTSNPSSPRLLRIKLTLSAPRELRVKAGDEVRAGELLSDRHTTHQRLLLQKRTLQTAAQHLQTQMQLAAASLQQLQSLGLTLPPTTFAAEQAAIRKAEAETVAVNRAVEIQQQRVSSFESLVSSWESLPPLEIEGRSARNPKLETRNLIQAHETARLTQAQERQALAQAEIEWQQAKLTTAREVRAWEEQKHRVEITRQLLTARSQQQQAATELARLTAQRAEIDWQLAQISAVRAPFAGQIKRIEWEEMDDEKLTVVVYLLIRQ